MAFYANQKTKAGSGAMNGKQNNIAALAALAYRALNNGVSEYARNKALIAQFFSNDFRRVSRREELCLTLIDSLYSTNVSAKRLYGIADIADGLRRVFKDNAALTECATRWIADDFDSKNPLCRLFAADYGLDKSGQNGKGAVSLLSKYLYFATGFMFPIYDTLGWKSRSITKVKLSRMAAAKGDFDFQKRFRALSFMLRESGIDGFDQLDCLLWLHGKVQALSFSTVLDEKRYVKLTHYAGKSGESAAIKKAVEDIRSGKNPDTLKSIAGAPLYKFIQATALGA
jgi:hypothetical protein